VLGLLSQAGHALPVVDLSAFLGLGKLEPSPDSPPRIVFVQDRGMHVGLTCNKVLGVQSDIDLGKPESAVLRGERLSSVLVGEFSSSAGVVGLLDVTALLEAARLR
jgi:chemotaxis signal transduction protein